MRHPVPKEKGGMEFSKMNITSLFFKDLFLLFLIIFLCVSVCYDMHECRCPQRPEALDLPEAGVVLA